MINKLKVLVIIVSILCVFVSCNKVNNETGTKSNTGSIRITTTDQYKSPMENVEYELQDESGNVVALSKTDEEGVLLFDNLKIGKYLVKQLSKREGYMMMDTPVEFNVKSDKVSETSIENRKIEGCLRVVALDKNKENKLAGITYEIYDKNGNLIETITTNEDGEAESGKLSYGSYSFKEIENDKTPSNVIIDSTLHSFTIAEDNVVEKFTITHFTISGS